MKYITLVAFLFSLSFISCSDDDNNGDDLPTCINDIRNDFRQDACEGSGDLTIWRLRGQDVYCFNIGNCVSDGSADIYDTNCNLICTLGGIAGNGVCDGVDWNTSAEFIELIEVF